MYLRDQLQELIELGPRGTAFRVKWELATRMPLRLGAADTQVAKIDGTWTSRLPFADPVTVADAMRERISSPSLTRLHEVAQQATRGRILCFGRWFAEYGNPIDWHLNPVTGARWNPEHKWSMVLADQPRVGDIKLTWEVARFPQAYFISRAAAFDPASADDFAERLTAQIESFIASNPRLCGVHWSSGQEIAFRLMAWVFALDVLLLRRPVGRWVAPRIARGLLVGAEHIEDVIDYARYAVYNNHLLSEAVGLYLTGVLLKDDPRAARWRALGRSILDEQSDAQCYRDGAYIQLSHMYHRVALQVLLWACVMARAGGDRPAQSWLRALDRSLDFLLMHQNPGDGRLPNYGPNDGSLPSPLSTCDFSDFRPVLQAVSALVRGERLYEPGPWDEMSAWLLGPPALDLPLRPPRWRTMHFTDTGFHVLRAPNPESFMAFRCGAIPDRFGQIDMLHVDVWWRGLNVVIDAGSYLYNDSPTWHAHFTRTGSHNTVLVDGRDQMLHFRKFKHLYRTRSKTLDVVSWPEAPVCAGEHYGYMRHPGGCIHRRAVALVKGDLVVVVDRVTGTGEHGVRLHWLCGEFPWRHEGQEARVVLETPAGPYRMAVFDEQARGLSGSVVAGQDDPPRGWLSRYYGEKVPVASMVVEHRTELPVTWISVLGPGQVALAHDGERYVASCDGVRASFTLDEGIPVICSSRIA